jgi:DNA-directed RNA polymerase subunit RPC12/RpoP
VTLSGMVLVGSSWLVILRCHQCSAYFHLKGIPAASISDTVDASRCPKCGSGMITGFPARKHQIVKLARERSGSE